VPLFNCGASIRASIGSSLGETGAPLLGFEGSFVTNLELPDNLALGRSVSHGFGWFRRALV
jgi:hypothetical protein